MSPASSSQGLPVSLTSPSETKLPPRSSRASGNNIMDTSPPLKLPQQLLHPTAPTLEQKMPSLALVQCCCVDGTGSCRRSRWWCHHLRWLLRSPHLHGHLHNFGESSFFSSPVEESDRSLFGAVIFHFLGARRVSLLIRRISNKGLQKIPAQMFSFTTNLGSLCGGLS